MKLTAKYKETTKVSRIKQNAAVRRVNNNNGGGESNKKGSNINTMANRAGALNAAYGALKEGVLNKDGSSKINARRRVSP